MKVKFLPSGEEHEIEFNETILHLAQRKGIHIQSVCKGLPSCAECRVRIIDGEHHVLPPSKKEIDLIGTAHYVDLSRLSCQLRCFGDVTIDLSEQIEKEQRAQNRPQERRRSDGEESRAVLGNILDNVESFDDELDQASSPSAKPQKKAKPDKKLDQRDAFYGSFYKAGEGKGNKKTGGKGGDNKKRRSRGGRNRNRNRNRKGGGGSGGGGARTSGSSKSQS